MRNTVMRRLVSTALAALLLVAVLLGINAHAMRTAPPSNGLTDGSYGNGVSYNQGTGDVVVPTPNQGNSVANIVNVNDTGYTKVTYNGNGYTYTTYKPVKTTTTTTVITKTITQTITQTVYVYTTYTPQVIGYYLASIEELTPPVPPWRFVAPTTVGMSTSQSVPAKGGYLVITAGLGSNFFIGNATKTIVEKYSPVITYTESVSYGSGPMSVSTNVNQSVWNYTTTQWALQPVSITNNYYYFNTVIINKTTTKYIKFKPFYYNTTIPLEQAQQGWDKFMQGVRTGNIKEAAQGATQWVYNSLKYDYEAGWNNLQRWWYKYVANGEYQQWLAHVLSAPAEWLSRAVGAVLGGSASVNNPYLTSPSPGYFGIGNDLVGINPVNGQPLNFGGSGFLIHPG